MQSRVPFMAAAVAVTLLSGAAAAQPFPSRSVRIVVGFQAGGGTDIAARVIAQKLSDALGVSFIVDNRPGAAGNIGADIVAKSNADGYTILMANSTIAIPSLSAKLPFDVKKDFAPLSNIALGPSVLIVNPDLPVTDIKGLVALAKARPNTLIYGSGGVGNVTHLAMELFMSMTGTDMVHVPYKGNAGVMTDLVGGQIQVTLDNLTPYMAQVKSGKIRLLAVSPAKRSQAVPDVPTIAEAGVPGYETGAWFGLVAPAKTPRDIVEKLSAETARILKLPDVKQKLMEQSAEPVGNTPQQFDAFIKSEIAKWAKVIKDAKVELQ